MASPLAFPGTSTSEAESWGRRRRQSAQVQSFMNVGFRVGSSTPTTRRNSTLEQAALYTLLREARCTVLIFEDHPQFFGNWRAHFKHRQGIFEVVCDNREGWLSLWRQENEQKSVRLHEVEASRLGESGQLSTLRGWLHELSA